MYAIVKFNLNICDNYLKETKVLRDSDDIRYSEIKPQGAVLMKLNCEGFSNNKEPT